MDTDDLTITTIRDGAACTLIVSGELCYSSASGFLQYAARVVDDRIEQFVLDLAGVTFLDCTGLRALALVTGFAPGSCPVIMRSLSPAVHRIFALLDLDPEKIRDLIADLGPGAWLRDQVTAQEELGQAGAGDLDLDA